MGNCVGADGGQRWRVWCRQFRMVTHMARARVAKWGIGGRGWDARSFGCARVQAYRLLGNGEGLFGCAKTKVNRLKGGTGKGLLFGLQAVWVPRGNTWNSWNNFVHMLPKKIVRASGSGYSGLCLGSGEKCPLWYLDFNLGAQPGRRKLLL